MIIMNECVPMHTALQLATFKQKQQLVNIFKATFYSEMKSPRLFLFLVTHA